MTPKIPEELEQTKHYGNGILETYLTFHGNTTGMIRLVYRQDKPRYTISEAKLFRVAFEGKYDNQYPMLGTAELHCLTEISNKIKEIPL